MLSSPQFPGLHLWAVQKHGGEEALSLLALSLLYTPIQPLQIPPLSVCHHLSLQSPQIMSHWLSLPVSQCAPITGLSLHHCSLTVCFKTAVEQFFWNMSSSIAAPLDGSVAAGVSTLDAQSQRRVGEGFLTCWVPSYLS